MCFRYDEKNELMLLKNEENKENVKVEKVNSKIVSNTKFIECMKMFQMMNDSPNKMLLVDCRSSTDFQSSKIIFGNQINIPEEIINKG